MKIKIVNGTYGYVPEGSSFVTPVQAGDPPIEVRDNRARELIAMGVAEAVQENESASVSIDADECDAAMPRKVLDEIALAAGVENPQGLPNKAAVIAAIDEARRKG